MRSNQIRLHRERSVGFSLTLTDTDTWCALSGRHDFRYLECGIFGNKCAAEFYHTICDVCGIDFWTHNDDLESI